MKNTSDNGWDRTSDIPICSTGQRVSLTRRPPLPPRKYSWYLFLLLSRNQGHSAIGRILCQWKIPVTTAGIEPATFRFVAQHPNHNKLMYLCINKILISDTQPICRSLLPSPGKGNCATTLRVCNTGGYQQAETANCACEHNVNFPFMTTERVRNLYNAHYVDSECKTWYCYWWLILLTVV